MKICLGCGNTETIEEIRARNPKAISCCPERKMVTEQELWDLYHKEIVKSKISLIHVRTEIARMTKAADDLIKRIEEESRR